MAFDASGTFTRLRGNDSWKGDAIAGTKIKSDLHDDNDNDLANGLTECITRSGKSPPTADIPWGGRKITNLANGTASTDAVNLGQLGAYRTFSTGIDLPGTDTNGRLSFTAPSGVNGIAWTASDLFFGTRPAVAGQSPNRFVYNGTASGTGNDVLAISEDGIVTAPSYLTFSTNGFYVGAAWRTPVPGKATTFQMSPGNAAFATNVTPTGSAYAVASMLHWWSTAEVSGSATMTLNKSGSGKIAEISARMGDKPRWLLQLGNNVAETGANAGSNFALYAYDDAGTTPSMAMSVIRSTRAVQFYGPLTAPGGFSSDDVLERLALALDRIAALEARIEALEVAP